MSEPESYMLPCLTKKYTGIECLGCGIQRSFHLLLHGEFVEAFKMYPAIYLLILFFGFIGINFFFKFKNSNKITTILAILTITVIVASYIFKIIN